MAQTERTSYNSILALESQQDSLQQALSAAESNLTIVQEKYDFGVDSKIDLETAQSDLAQAKQSLMNNIGQHQLEVMSFETLWVSS